jgi:two-component system, NarL family, invasion response regulator UvrY
MSSTPRRPVRVLTVDDQAVFRAAARDVIDATPGFHALAEAASGAEALAMTESLRPDLILMDIRMPGMDGIETTRRLRDAGTDSVVVLISFEDPVDVDAVALGCGAAAAVRKQDFCPDSLRGLWEILGLT